MGKGNFSTQECNKQGEEFNREYQRASDYRAAPVYGLIHRLASLKLVAD
ncbi:hypothetical protein [Devosia sp. Naph2]